VPAPATTEAGRQCSVTATYQGHDTVLYAVTSNMPGHRVKISLWSGASQHPQGWITTGADGSGQLTGNAQGAPEGYNRQFTVTADFYEGSSMVEQCRGRLVVP
jgi:hypothetical protein